MPKYSKRKDGRYVYQFRVGYSDTGKRVMRTVYGKTVAELEAKIAQAKQTGIYHPSALPVAEYAEQYVQTYKAAKAENTIEMYERSIRYHVRPLFDGVRMDDLTEEQIQRAVNTLQGKRRTAEVMLTLLRQICRKATEDGIYSKNPCEHVTLPPKVPKRKKKVLTEADTEKVWNAQLPEREKALLFLLFGCGLRREEALGLRLCDVSEDSVNVSQAVVFPKESAVLKRMPKNGSSIRTVPLPEAIARNVIPYRDIRMEDEGGDLQALLFASVTSKSIYRRMWERIQAQIGDYTAHELRHSYATQLYYSGLTLKQAAELLGHSDTQMLLRIYAHLQEDREDIRTKLNGAFSGK